MSTTEEGHTKPISEEESTKRATEKPESPADEGQAAITTTENSEPMASDPPVPDEEQPKKDEPAAKEEKEEPKKDESATKEEKKEEPRKGQPASVPPEQEPKKDEPATKEDVKKTKEAEKGDKDSSKETEKTDKFTYRDFSHIQSTPTPTVTPNSTAIRVQKLPAKLNAMLSNPEFQHIISWMPHGRSWKVHNPHAFVEEVIPKYFEYTNYNSFVRLVNAWGFRRITKGTDRNSYYHELFLRGMPHLHAKMHRLTASEKKLPLDPEDEPDLYKISALCPLPPPTPSPVVPGMGKGMARGPPRNPLQLQKQMMANQKFQGGMGGLGNPNFMAGAGMFNYPDLASARMAGANPMMQAAAAAQLEEEEMAMAAAGVGGAPGAAAGFGQMGNPSIQQQRAELLAANQAYELQLNRLRQQEQRLLQAQANLPVNAGAAAGMPYGGAGGGGAGMGRMGRGGGMMGAAPAGMGGGGLTPEDMLAMGGGDPSGGMGPMSPAMMARLQQQQSQMPPGMNQMKRGF